jgi:hypothetical protein
MAVMKSVQRKEMQVFDAECKIQTQFAIFRISSSILSGNCFDANLNCIKNIEILIYKLLSRAHELPACDFTKRKSLQEKVAASA